MWGRAFQAGGLADAMPEVGVRSVGSESKKKRAKLEHSEGERKAGDEVGGETGAQSCQGTET